MSVTVNLSKLQFMRKKFINIFSLRS